MARVEAPFQPHPVRASLKTHIVSGKLESFSIFYAKCEQPLFCVNFSLLERPRPHSDHQGRSASRTVKGRRTHPDPDAI